MIIKCFTSRILQQESYYYFDPRYFIKLQGNICNATPDWYKGAPLNNHKYVGLDVHQSSISIAVHNHQGKLIAQSIIETKINTIRAMLRPAASPMV